LLAWKIPVGETVPVAIPVGWFSLIFNNFTGTPESGPILVSCVLNGKHRQLGRLGSQRRQHLRTFLKTP